MLINVLEAFKTLFETEQLFYCNTLLLFILSSNMVPSHFLNFLTRRSLTNLLQMISIHD